VDFFGTQCIYYLLNPATTTEKIPKLSELAQTAPKFPDRCEEGVHTCKRAGSIMARKGPIVSKYSHLPGSETTPDLEFSDRDPDRIHYIHRIWLDPDPEYLDLAEPDQHGIPNFQIGIQTGSIISTGSGRIRIQNIRIWWDRINMGPIIFR